MTYSKEMQDSAIEYAIRNSVRESAEAHIISMGTIRIWAKERGVRFTGHGGRRRHPKLIDVPIPPFKNTASRHRYYLLHIYHYTCYDCGVNDSTGESLQQHADYNKYPVELVILCMKCHGKRERHDNTSKTKRLG